MSQEFPASGVRARVRTHKHTHKEPADDLKSFTCPRKSGGMSELRSPRQPGVSCVCRTNSGTCWEQGRAGVHERACVRARALLPVLICVVYVCACQVTANSQINEDYASFTC